MLWTEDMPAKLLPLRGRGGRVKAACVLFALGVGLISPPVEAQSDIGARAPWQAPQIGRDESPSGASPSGSCRRSDDSAPTGEDEGNCAQCGCDAGPGCPCNGGCDFSNPWICGLDSFVGCDRLWFRGEYLLWWEKSANLPPLVTTSPAGTPFNEAGVLGQPGTTVLFGGSVDAGARSGARLSLGYWLNPCHDLGLEADYMFLGNKAVTFDETSQGDPILAQTHPQRANRPARFRGHSLPRQADRLGRH